MTRKQKKAAGLIEREIMDPKGRKQTVWINPHDPTAGHRPGSTIVHSDNRSYRVASDGSYRRQ